jgi:hypothetical protein
MTYMIYGESLRLEFGNGSRTFKVTAVSHKLVIGSDVIPSNFITSRKHYGPCYMALVILKQLDCTKNDTVNSWYFGAKHLNQIRNIILKFPVNISTIRKKTSCFIWKFNPVLA